MERDGIKRFAGKRDYRGKEIWAEGTLTEGGMNLLLCGGDKPHVGAVGSAADGTVELRQFAGHREGTLCREWCEALAAAGWTAVVSAGVHYDHATPEDIAAVLRLSEELLEELLGWLEGEKAR